MYTINDDLSVSVKRKLRRTITTEIISRMLNFNIIKKFTSYTDLSNTATVYADTKMMLTSGWIL